MRANFGADLKQWKSAEKEDLFQVQRQGCCRICYCFGNTAFEPVRFLADQPKVDIAEREGLRDGGMAPQLMHPIDGPVTGRTVEQCVEQVVCISLRPLDH